METNNIVFNQLTIETLPEFIATYETVIMGNTSIRLIVDEFDSAGYQLFCSIAKRLAARGTSFIIESTPYSLELLSLFGVNATLKEIQYETA